MGIRVPDESTKFEKSPLFIAAVGTVPMEFCAWFWRNQSALKWKKVRFLPL